MCESRTKIVLVEDTVVLRESVKTILGEIPDLVVCGEYESVREAIEGIDRIGPDVVVLDIGLKTGNGLDVLRYLNKVHPHCRVIVFSNRVDRYYREEALLWGASHVFNKFTESEQLFDAVAAIVVSRPHPQQSRSILDVTSHPCSSKLSSNLSIGEKQCI